MSSQKISLLLVNVVGGVAVLGSYALWLSNSSNDPAALWGSVSGVGRALYAASMVLAAAGYFAFVIYLLRFGSDRDRSPALEWITTLFALILFPSALWMPLACEYLDAPSAGLWWAMRATLAVVGLASLALVYALVRLEPGARAPARVMAVAGATAFTFQTLVLDAVIWPLLFPR